MKGQRRVRRLDLHGARDPADLRRAAALIEDAFHTASLPRGRPGWVLLIRRLDLGEVELERPAQAMSERIGTQVRALLAGAVPADHPRAGRAAAVWFRSRPAARGALAVRLATGRPPTEWFWSAALPEWAPRSSASAALQALLAPSARPTRGEPPPLVAAAQALGEVVRSGQLPAVLALAPREVAAWGPAWRAQWSVAPLAGPPAPGPAPVVGAGWREAIAWAVSAYGVDDPRPAWIACCALLDERPERLLTPELPGLALALVLAARPEAAAPRPPAGPAESQPAPARPSPESLAPPAAPATVRSDPTPGEPQLASAPTPAPSPAPSRLAETEPAPVAPPDRPGPSPQPADPSSSPSPVGKEPEPAPARAPVRWLASSELSEPRRAGAGLPDLSEPTPTALAGLLFLVPVLERLGLPELLLAEPALVEQALPWRVLRAVLDQLEADPEEPLRRALAPASPPPPLGREPWLAPPRWWADLAGEGPLTWRPGPGGQALVAAGSPDLVLARWFGPPAPPLSDALAGRTLRTGPPVDASLVAAARVLSWVQAAERWCRGAVGRDLAQVVRRPGLVAATRTHIDLVLPYSSLDLDLRRAALDTDPGWVPWLGRIVQYHYVDDAELARWRRG